MPPTPPSAPAALLGRDETRETADDTPDETAARIEFHADTVICLAVFQPELINELIDAIAEETADCIEAHKAEQPERSVFQADTCTCTISCHPERAAAT